MAKSLAEYLDWLDERDGLIWPEPPAVKPIKATPHLKPIAGIKLITWNVYGTLLRIDTGKLHQIHPQQLRMQVALDKTIQEFNMWQSMSRKPGQPWEYMLQQYTKLVEDARLQGTGRKGDIPFIDSAKIWGKLIDRLERNEYEWDQSIYGNRDQLALKVAYFFHASLQGVSATEGAAESLSQLTQAGYRQGLLGSAQAFTLGQLLRAFRQQRTLPDIGDVFSPDAIVLSFQVGVDGASPSVYETAAERFSRIGISPQQVLHITNDIPDNLKPAKATGFRTALLVADANCTQVDNQAVRDPETRPDRLLTNLSQVRELVGA